MPINLISPRRQIGELEIPTQSVQQAQVPGHALERLGLVINDATEKAQMESDRNEASLITLEATKLQKEAILTRETDDPQVYKSFTQSRFAEVQEEALAKASNNRVKAMVKVGVGRSAIGLSDNLLERYNTLFSQHELGKIDSYKRTLFEYVAISPEDERAAATDFEAHIAPSIAMTPAAKIKAVTDFRRELAIQTIARDPDEYYEKSRQGVYDKLPPDEKQTLDIRAATVAKQKHDANKEKQDTDDDVELREVRGLIENLQVPTESIRARVLQSYTNGVLTRKGLDKADEWIRERNQTTGSKEAGDHFLDQFYSGGTSTAKVDSFNRKLDSLPLRPEDRARIRKELAQERTNIISRGQAGASAGRAAESAAYGKGLDYIDANTPVTGFPPIDRPIKAKVRKVFENRVKGNRINSEKVAEEIVSKMKDIGGGESIDADAIKEAKELRKKQGE
jgi:hypothetical protein